MGESKPSLAACCLAEMLGTFVLIFFGCGAVHGAIVLGTLTGLWQASIVWGVAVMVAAYVFGGISGAHINPAITAALAVWGQFPGKRVAPYIGSQLAGAFLAAAVLFALFHPFIAEKEAKKGVIRGEPGSEITAMCYGEYYPNPGRVATAEGLYKRDDHEQLKALVSMPVAFGTEVLGTLILALVVFALTDERNAAAPAARLAPVFIGLTVAILVAVIAPLTQSCLNPARDFGPRLLAFLAGWGSIAIPGPNGAGFLIVYIVAPTLGAVLGGGLYVRILRPTLAGPEEIKR